MNAKKEGHGLLRLIVTVVIAVGLAVLVKMFVVEPYSIPSASMQHTLNVGDRVVASKLSFYQRDPSPGDIVVFKAPSAWTKINPRETTLIKRVIAIGGESVRCCDAQGRMEIRAPHSTKWLPLDEPYIYQNFPLAQRQFPTVTVPAGRMWVMGDHRSDSADSLWHFRHDGGKVDEATVAKSSVIGKAVAGMWPLNRMSTLGTPATFQGRHLGSPDKINPWLIKGPALILLAVLILMPLAWAYERITSRRRGRSKQAERAQLVSTRGMSEDDPHDEREDVFYR